MTNRVDIHLENYNNYYVPGQIITGYVQCIFDKDKSVDGGVKISFEGEATTRWTESETRYNSVTKKQESHTVEYTGSEVFFATKLILFSGGPSRIIPRGVSNYPFSFTLPTSLPSSFVGSYGRVAYKVEAEVDRPFLKFNYKAVSKFIVVKILDLNEYPQLKESVSLRDEKKLWFSCTSGPIQMQLTVPFTGFAKGQRVPIFLYIENMSNSSIERVKYEITRILTYNSRNPRQNTKFEMESVYKKYLSGVGAHGEHSFDDCLEIPENLNSPNFQGCSLIKSIHVLEVKVYLPCPHRNMSHEVPVMLGNIPLQMAYNNANTSSSQISAPPSLAPTLAPPPAYNPAMMPPLPPLALDLVPVSAPTAPIANHDEFSDWNEIDATPQHSKPSNPSAPPSYEQATSSYGLKHS